MTKPSPNVWLRFPPTARVRRGPEFARVYEHGTRVSDQNLLLTGLRTGDGPTRLGLSVSKRCGNAVKRNRWKRLLREAFRLSQSDFPKGLDLVVQPHLDGLCELIGVQQSLTKLVRRLDKRLPVESQP